jgi:hypothetical protein
MRDQAGSLVGPGRTAKWIRRCGHHDHAAIIHRFELPPQQHCLLAGFPGMRHDFGRGLRVAGKRIEAQFHAGREDQSVVRQLAAVIQTHYAPRGIDGSCFAVNDIDSVIAQRAVTELLGLHLSQSGDYSVAQRTRDVSGIGLEQRDGDVTIFALDRASAARSREASTDDDDTR